MRKKLYAVLDYYDGEKAAKALFECANGLLGSYNMAILKRVVSYRGKNPPTGESYTTTENSERPDIYAIDSDHLFKAETDEEAIFRFELEYTI